MQAPFNHEVNLTDLDKIYLLLAEENLKDSFNVLCYDLQIHSLADLSKLDDEKLKRFRLLPNFAKDRLRQLPEKAKTTDFVYLAKVVYHFVCLQSQLGDRESELPACHTLLSLIVYLYLLSPSLFHLAPISL